jgi:acyl-CoA dehydrogenase
MDTTLVVFLAVVAALVLLGGLVFLVPGLRRPLISRPVMRLMAGVLPAMSDTERAALAAGTVWWDADLFSGRPDWARMLETPLPGLSRQEEAFLAGPVDRLCAMVDDWQTTLDSDLAPEVWDFLKENGFFGMIIPTEYSGLGFSARAHSEVITRLSSRSVALAVTVMVPSSLGPAELLLHYGTEEQKRFYLPRLASGEEMPCFALTEPGAGSDAASITSSGVVCRGSYQGREVLGMRLNWDKRYTTLSSVATLIGLAFRLQDPDGLLGGEEDRGITVALIPADLSGVEIGDRHDPLGIPFHNGPTRGTDVFVPLSAIIGGAERAGEGWQMLMQSLAAGRSISLPSQAVGGAELAARTAGAYATVREQFGLAIGRFEGIEEPLARIGGSTYLMNAARTVTASAVDLGERPSVLSAVVKQSLTEQMRRVVTDAMDIVGGAGISRGPNNILANSHIAAPIGITVEGANILTRTLIIFGQGALRCHPFARLEMEAVAAGDLKAFDTAFFGHVRHVMRNTLRCARLALSGGRLGAIAAPAAVRRPLRELDRLSAAFAVTADAAMASLGGDLKRREKLSGRLADALTWLYLGTATVKRYTDDGYPEADRHAFLWATETAACEIRLALSGFMDNLPSRFTARLLRALVFPWGSRATPPSDRRGTAVARGLLEGGEFWQRLTRHIYVPAHDQPGLGRLERALSQVLAARPVGLKLKQALREGTLGAQPADTLAARAEAAGILTAEECRLWENAREARAAAVSVDAAPARQESVAPVC